MLLFVGTKVLCGVVASCAGHTSTSRCGKNSMSSLWMRPGHRLGASLVTRNWPETSVAAPAQLSPRQSRKARPWLSFFSVCICFTEALGLAIGLVYIAPTNLRFSTSSFKLHGSHLPHRFRRLAYSRRSCGFRVIPRGWSCRAPGSFPSARIGVRVGIIP